MSEPTDLDPGIADLVHRLIEAKFETTDSGDGHSKPADWYASGEALPFPHVAAVVAPSVLLSEADRMAALLPVGWSVEASYSTQDRTGILFARPDDASHASPCADLLRELKALRDEWWVRGEASHTHADELDALIRHYGD